MSKYSKAELRAMAIQFLYDWDDLRRRRTMFTIALKTNLNIYEVEARIARIAKGV